MWLKYVGEELYHALTIGIETVGKEFLSEKILCSICEELDNELYNSLGLLLWSEFVLAAS